MTDFAHMDDMLDQMSSHLLRTLADYAQHPTERNQCFVIGYLAALQHEGLISDDLHSYTLALAGQILDVEFIATNVVNYAKGHRLA